MAEAAGWPSTCLRHQKRKEKGREGQTYTVQEEAIFINIHPIEIPSCVLWFNVSVFKLHMADLGIILFLMFGLSMVLI